MELNTDGKLGIQINQQGQKSFYGFLKFSRFLIVLCILFNGNQRVAEQKGEGQFVFAELNTGY